MKTVSILAATLLLGITAQAQAEEPRRSIAVQYADLDLERSEGAHALYARIRSAARVVCPDLSSESLLNAQKVGACRRAAIDAAIVSVNRPALTALHRQTRDGARQQVAGGLVLR